MKLISKYCALAALSLLATCMGCQSYEEKGLRMAVLDKNRIFNEFDGKREREIELKNLESAFQHYQDSVSLILRITNGSKQLVDIERSFSEERKRKIDMWDTQIWAQLDSYTKAYCTEKGYDILLSTGPGDNVLFADSTLLITDQFIQYANRKYQGN
jgi:Skp family chaperone for outer membrane proteins